MSKGMRIDKMRYAVGRVDQILQDKLNEIRQQCTKPGSPPSDAQKLKAIREGTASLRRNAEMSDDLNNAFVFNIRVQDQFDQAKFEKLAKPLREKAVRIKDEIMLGSEQAAIEMIEKFRTGKS